MPTPLPFVQTFKTPGTFIWTKASVKIPPAAGIDHYNVQCIGPGGGGMSGSANSQAVSGIAGAAGGSEGGYAAADFTPANMPNSAVVTIPPGGSGGAAVVANLANPTPNGLIGGQSGSTSFDIYMVATSGGCGVSGFGGGSGTVTGPGTSNPVTFQGANGNTVGFGSGNGNPTNGIDGQISTFPGGGGGGGNGGASINDFGNGLIPLPTLIGGAGVGGASGMVNNRSSGGLGQNVGPRGTLIGTTSQAGFSGSGGGAIASYLATDVMFAGQGGDGTIPGQGGGGGGQVPSEANPFTTGQNTTGRGGNGAPGGVIVTTFFFPIPVYYYNWDLVTWFHMSNMARPISLTGRYKS